MYDRLCHHSSLHRVMVFSALTLSISVVLKQSHDIIHLRQQANMRSVHQIKRINRELSKKSKISKDFLLSEKYFLFLENNFKYVTCVYLLEFDIFCLI